MSGFNLKVRLILAVAVIAVLSTVAWREIIQPTISDRGNGHIHDENVEHVEDAGSHESEKDPHEHESHAETDSHDDHEEHTEGTITLTQSQLHEAGVTVAEARSGTIESSVSMPAKIAVADNRLARIVPKIGGIVTDVRKNIGDQVALGEIVAVIESREMADSVADYLGAMRTLELAEKTYLREQSLWTKKITAEQDYLAARNAFQETKIKSELSKEKLLALGLDAAAVAELLSPSQANKSRFYHIKSPISGRVIDREITLGEYVDTTHVAFSIADLQTLWVKAAVPSNDLRFIKEGQSIRITNDDAETQGKVIFINPVIDDQTGTSTAIAEFTNPDNDWRPGEFVNVLLTTSLQPAEIVIPKEALQEMDGKDVVFIRTEHGFRQQVVTIGRQDQAHVEIVSGLKAGEEMAISNTFMLKAELGKSEAEHEH